MLLTNNEQNFWVIDNFYKDPDSIRSLALSSDYSADIRFYKGYRSNIFYRPEEIKDFFEKIIGRKITNWEHGTNGRFQYTTPEDPLVYHQDSQTHAAVVYLDPNAPLYTGTSFYTSKHENPFSWGFLDETKFEKVDSVGNVYNRAIIFRANLIHAASKYYGQSKEDSRLVQLFFFDCKG